jgi:hypothetical protein
LPPTFDYEPAKVAHDVVLARKAESKRDPVYAGELARVAAAQNDA